jgi:hypothetical protein
MSLHGNKQPLLDIDPMWIMEMMVKLEGDERLFEDSMRSKSMGYILHEALEQADVEELKSSISGTKDTMGKIQKAVEKSPELKSHMDSLIVAIGKAETFASGLDLENPEGFKATVSRFFGKAVDAKRALQSVLGLQTKSKSVADALESGVPFVLKSLEPFMADDEMKKKPLSDLEGTEGMPSADKLSGGFVKALKSGQPGWAGKLMGRLTGAFGKDELTSDVTELDTAQAAEDMLGLSYNDIEEMSKALEAAPDVPRTDTAASEDLAEPSGGGGAGGATGGAGDGQPVEGEDAPEPTEEEPAGVKVTADDFATFVKDKASLVTKAVGSGNPARKARKDLRGALDQLAGGGIFQENMAKLTDNEFKLVLLEATRRLRQLTTPRLTEIFIPANDLINIPEPSEDFEKESLYSQDDMIRYRLMKMAGVDR